MNRKSEYPAGTFLTDESGAVFIHDGSINGNGYGCAIGETSTNKKIKRCSVEYTWCKYPIRGLATPEEIIHLLNKIKQTDKILYY
jgi:hypothetical protein